MKNYSIEYELDGEIHTQNIEATTPGQAQAKLPIKFPGAKITRCSWYGHLAGKLHMPMVHINYEIASTAKVTPLQADPLREQSTFGFVASLKPRPPR